VLDNRRTNSEVHPPRRTRTASGAPLPSPTRESWNGIRVLHVVPTVGRGGASLGAIELMIALEGEHSVNTRLCVLGRPALGFEIPNALSEPSYLGAANPNETSSIPSLVWKLRKVVREGRYDIVHSHLYPDSLVAAVASAAAGHTLHLAHIRDTPPSLADGGIKREVRRTLLRLAYGMGRTRFVAVSQDAADYAMRHLSLENSRVTVMTDGINPHRIVRDARHLPRPDQERITIGAAGRLVPEKGFDVLIKAVARLVEARPNLVLRIAGSGSQHKPLANLAKSLGLAGQVEFLAEIEDMASFYSRLDVFVLPSLSSEGLPRVMLEAMFAGVPIVATDTAGTGVAISDGVTGALVGVGDVEGLVRALSALANNPSQRAALAEAAQKNAWQRFTISRVAREIAEHYRQMLQ